MRVKLLGSLLLLSLIAWGVPLGCPQQEGNWLDGSLADSYDMRFDYVRARLYDSELSVEYVVDTDQGEKVALRVTLNVVDGPPVVDTVYDLATDGNVGRGEGFGSSLPDLESGTVTFEEFAAESGSPVAGTFDAVFITPDDSKYNLLGGFEAELEVVDL